MLLIMAAILGFAAWCDLATRTIPDRCSLALLAVGLGYRLLEGPAAAAASLGVALLIGVGFLFLHARGMIGGGDVKLIAAIAVGFAPSEVPELLFAIGIAGGILALLYLGLSRIMPKPAFRPQAALPLRVAVLEAHRIARRGPMPYALAIAAGTVAAGLGA
ncbi:A24 family peptidase [Falsiroseomonas oryzae]|uniref:A24 family peptidase n=1 Tax=Falsiroseomonas oryzae TaxID=2766473 RepID=UPI0022EB9F08|nr:A24 family peptidase [Roseomonas sp. MO-31]